MGNGNILRAARVRRGGSVSFMVGLYSDGKAHGRRAGFGGDLTQDYAAAAASLSLRRSARRRAALILNIGRRARLEAGLGQSFFFG